MMRLLGSLLLALLCVTKAQARGGHEDIGGGDAVWVQYNGSPAFAYVLDYYMGLRLRYIPSEEDLLASMGPAQGEAPEVKVRRVIARVGQFDSVLEQRATAMLAEFLRVRTFPRFPVRPIDDEDLEIDIEHESSLVQAATWELDEQGHVIRWEVNRDIWQALDANDKAGLILHEIFYVLHAKDRNAADRRLATRSLRKFVAKISSSWLTRADARQWRQFARELDLFATGQ